MTISLKHAFDMPPPDDADPNTASPSDWNAEHVLIQAGQRMLGKPNAGNGATAEMTSADVLNFAGADAAGAAAAVAAAAVLDGDTAAGDFAGTYPNPTVKDFVASGASHAHGAVPDPGAAPGSSKFLREDASWATPAGGAATFSLDGGLLTRQMLQATCVADGDSFDGGAL